MKYTFKEIRESYSNDKKKSDGVIDHIFNRPLSFPISWFCLNLRLKPNTITYFSVLLCLIAFIFSFIEKEVFQNLAPCLFIFFAVLDCVDGNMARTMDSKGIKRKNAKMGAWLDALAGYFAYVTITLSMSVSSFYILKDTNINHAIFVFFIGSLASSGNMFMRAIVQSYKVASKADTKSIAGKSKSISQEIGITGFMPFLYLLGVFTSFLPYIILAYALIFLGGAFLTMLRLIMKVEQL